MKKKIQKPFNVEDAKKGAKVETKNGKSIRILCYDKVGNNRPIVALLNEDGFECCVAYTIDGRLYGYDFDNDDDKFNLVIIEEIKYKFDEGDYIVSDIGNIYKITRIDDMYHTKQLSSGYEQRWTIEDIDRVFHKWTLNDARPGDVLVCKNDDRPFIFKGCIDEAHPGYPTAYCGINCSGELTSNAGQTWWTDSSVRPATYKEKQQFFNRLNEEGYKWDAESFTLSKIQERWRDKDDAEINDYYIHSDSFIIKHSGYNSIINHNVFATEKQAKAALAMAQISQIMANDERFGGIVTDKEWSDNHWRYAIIRSKNGLELSLRYYGYEYLAFHTREQAELFLEENEDLIKDYYMLD